MDFHNLFSINGKTALITGAAAGIGNGIAKAFAALGCAVTVADIDGDAANRTAEDIKKSAGRAIATICDVVQPDDVKAAVAMTVETFGGLDILVNNAGIAMRAKAEEMTDEQWDDVADINLKGAFLFCREAGKVMIRAG